jgi:hypothetical protein
LSLTLALLNGRVRTLDPDRPHAGAIGIAGAEVACCPGC